VDPALAARLGRPIDRSAPLTRREVVSAISQASSEPGKLSQARVWAWPLAALLGFPIGGYLANLAVGAVDSAGTAIAGGLIAGAVIGTAQWVALRQVVPWVWIAATSLGMGVGLAIGAAIVDYGVDRGDLMLMGAVTGLAVGGFQAFVLAQRGRAGRGGGWWRTRRRGRLPG
jgi:hypothetical protein